MNWHYILYFCTAAQTGSFTKAAEEKYVSVSALSKAISALETELGVPLFTKRGRNVYLTEYGTVFYNYAEKAIAAIAEGKAHVESMARNELGRVTIAGIQTMCAHFLPKMIYLFSEAYPKIHITMGSAISAEVLDQLLEGEIDLGFCSDFNIKDSQYQGLERVLLKLEDYCIVVSPEHRLANLSDISLADLESETLIMPKNPRSRNRIAFEELCREQGISLQIAYELPDDTSIMGFVGAGVGVSFMSDFSSMHRNDLQAIPIRGLERSQNQYMVWKKTKQQKSSVVIFRDFILHNI